MKKSVRILSILLLLSMLTFLVSGCDGGEAASTGSTSASGNPTETIQATPEAVTDGPEDDGIEPYIFPLNESKTITFWKGFSNIFSAYVSSTSDVLFYKEFQERLNFSFEFIEVSDIVAVEQFNIMVAGGDYADILDNNINSYAGGIEKAVSDGVVQPFDDYIESCMPNYLDVISSNPEWELAAITGSGNYAAVYTFPLEGATPTVSLSIRQDFMDGLGLDSPKTYDDYYEVLKAFKSEYGATLWMNQLGSLFGNAFSGGFGVATYESGQDTMFMLKNGTEVTYGAMEDGFLDYLTYMNMLYKENLIYDDFMSTVVAMSPQADIILSDKIGVFISGVTSYPTYNAQGTEGFHIAAANPPVVNEGDKFTFSKTDGIQTGWVMSTQCSDPVLVSCVIDYLYSEEGFILSNYGIEGETFEYVDGEPMLTDIVLRNPDGMVYFIALNVYLGDSPKVNDWRRPQRYYTDDQKAAGAIWGSDNSSYIPAQISLNEEEVSIYGSKFPEVSTYTAEMMLSFITGAVPLSEFDSFRDTLISLGANDCITVWQQAVDRYYAKANSLN